MVATWIEKIGQLFWKSSRQKILYANCLSRRDIQVDEQVDSVKAIAMNAEQDNTNYGSRGWQLDKLQRVKPQD